MFPSLCSWSSFERSRAPDLSGYHHHSSDLNIDSVVHTPKKPSLKSVPLPGTPLLTGNAPMATYFPTDERSGTSSRASERPSPGHGPYSPHTITQTPKGPLKGILKKSGQSSNPPPNPTPLGQDDYRLESGSHPTQEGDHHSDQNLDPAGRGPTRRGSSGGHTQTNDEERFSSSKGAQRSMWRSTSSPIESYSFRVPMKPEAIALSWPLTKPNQRRTNTTIRFDVAEDPTQDNTVTISNGVYTTYMPKEMLRIPASTHCTLTEMRIYLNSEELKCWPINVQRNDGICCLDVFEAIYHTLHFPLTDEDEELIDKVHVRRRPGLRRVNLLRGRRIFRGLIQSDQNWIAMMC
ncbi:hypothetical protein F5890DRAFT_743915 [Lentinula detonsa]|uniref:DUF6699 domain-containing protein n=1 Tax=Lentinula detonsa TaxID=2804962 RepID=A0AA38PRJ3_9AGAR|nr:hypothetical protein F5890DRAFT_743915 [Lentinula detonsa]